MRLLGEREHLKTTIQSLSEQLHCSYPFCSGKVGEQFPCRTTKNNIEMLGEPDVNHSDDAGSGPNCGRHTVDESQRLVAWADPKQGLHGSYNCGDKSQVKLRTLQLSTDSTRQFSVDSMRREFGSCPSSTCTPLKTVCHH